jgi:AraC-like DNA-binding protein
MRQARSGIDLTVGILAQLRTYLEDAGADFPAIARGAGIDPAVLGDPDGRIPVEAYLDIEDEAALVTGDPCLGLHMGEFVAPEHWSVAGYYMSRCANLGEVFLKGGRYARIIGNLISAKAWPVRGRIRVQLGAPRWAPEMSRHCFEATLASSMTLARRLTGLDVDPIAVRLPGERPEDDGEYRRVFRCPVHFGAKNPGMDIPFSMVSLPLAEPDPELASRFAAWAEERLAAMPALRLTSERVARLILGRLDDPKLSVGAVAREMGLSPRSLQSLLAVEGTEFSRLLREVRESLARECLRSKACVEDIACQLGFSEVSAFRRAFKQWTGMTPAEYRVAAAGI